MVCRGDFRTCVVSLSLLVAACADDEPGVADQSGACVALENQRFQSEELQTDCGPAPMPVTCQWSVQFAPSTDEQTEYHYNFQDTGETGYVHCDGSYLRVGDREVGVVDASADRIEWYRVTYVREE